MGTQGFACRFGSRRDPDRVLYLAVRETVYLDVFREPIGEILLENKRIRLVVFDDEKEVITRWIP